jgi:hypothetical protein
MRPVVALRRAVEDVLGKVLVSALSVVGDQHDAARSNDTPSATRTTRHSDEPSRHNSEVPVNAASISNGIMQRFLLG